MTASGRHARPTLVDRYRAFLPVSDATPVVSLGEGMTPLVHLRRLGSRLGLRLAPDTQPRLRSLRLGEMHTCWSLPVVV